MRRCGSLSASPAGPGEGRPPGSWGRRVAEASPGGFAVEPHQELSFPPPARYRGFLERTSLSTREVERPPPLRGQRLPPLALGALDERPTSNGLPGSRGMRTCLPAKAGRGSSVRRRTALSTRPPPSPRDLQCCLKQGPTCVHVCKMRRRRRADHGSQKNNRATRVQSRLEFGGAGSSLTLAPSTSSSSRWCPPRRSALRTRSPLS